MTPDRGPTLETDALASLLAEVSDKDWVGVIKPNGKGTGLVGRKAERGTGAQGCIAVVNSIPGGKERVAITKLLALAPILAAEVLRLRDEMEGGILGRVSSLCLKAPDAVGPASDSELRRRTPPRRNRRTV